MMTDWVEHIELNGTEVLRPFKWFGKSELLGQAFFCSECGDIWARKWAVPQGALPTKPSFWICAPRSCTKHGNGSLFEHLTEFCGFVEDAANAPRQLLLHEFLCATNGNYILHYRSDS